MGGGGGGYIPPIDLDKLTERANARIQSALKDDRATVFVCDPADAASVHQKIRDSVFSNRNTKIASSVEELEEVIADASLVVFYVDKSQIHDVINEAIAVATKLRVQNFFVHAREQYSMPNRVLQFRVRTMSWDKFIEIVTGH